MSDSVHNVTSSAAVLFSEAEWGGEKSNNVHCESDSEQKLHWKYLSPEGRLKIETLLSSRISEADQKKKKTKANKVCLISLWAKSRTKVEMYPWS